MLNLIFYMFDLILQIQVEVAFGQAPFVQSSQFGWKNEQAKRLTYQQDKGRWQINLQLREPVFEYKYAVGDWEGLNDHKIQWERGPNRRVDLNQQPSPILLVDRWEKRCVKLKLENSFFFPLILVAGNCEELMLPQQMKARRIGEHYLYYLRIHLNLDELDKDISIFYNLITGSKEFIFNKFTINYSADKAKRFVTLSSES